MNKVLIALICLSLIALTGCFHIGSGSKIGVVTKFEGGDDMLFYGEMTTRPNNIADAKQEIFKFSIDKDNVYKADNTHIITELKVCMIQHLLCKVEYQRELIVLPNRAKSTYLITNVTELD